MLDPEKFATVKIHVKGKDDKAKYILQLLDGSNALKQEKRDVTTGDWQFNYVPAGEIKFRIIEDMNSNGKWDTGNVVERLQPRTGRNLCQRRGRRHLCDQDQLGGRIFDRHEPGLRSGDDGVAFAPARRA